jgi:hypothetical protein
MQWLHHFPHRIAPQTQTAPPLDDSSEKPAPHVVTSQFRDRE